MGQPTPHPRVAVIGDIGGHTDELYAALVAVGADPDDCTLPEGLTVIQVGDLVDRGPDSAGVLRLVDEVMAAHPDQWIQLIGNHEANHLGPRQLGRTDLDSDGVATLRRWHHDGLLRIAATVATSVGDLLVTHAGVGPAFWNSRGRLTSASDMAADLNDMLDARRWTELAAPGRLLADHTRGSRFHQPRPHPPGPLWAEAGWEIHGAWLEVADELPWSQIHGHSVPFRYHSSQWISPPSVAAAATVDTANRWVTTTVGARRIVAVDPSLGRYGGVRWRPYVLDGAVT